VAYLVEGLAVDNDLRIKVSRYVSYLLRHNPEDLEMEDEGFVALDQLLSKVRSRFPTIDKKLLVEMVELSERRRFEIVGDKIRALYGHTINVHVHLKEDTQVERLYHGTTPEAPSRF
jgi:putative RNA 2'-phosphotransferase